MTWQLDDTIAALASAPGPAARSVIRVSGQQVVERLRSVLRGTDWPVDALPRRYHVEILVDEECPLRLSLFLWPTNRSYTGQPMAELHLIGSPPLVEEVLSQLFADGIRPARPGEFTLRAFLAGRIDLVQAEAVLGIIDADDHEELQLALGQLAGGISSQLQTIQTDLISLLGDLEAGLDFVEEDIEFVTQQQIVDRIDSLCERLETLQSQATDRMVTAAQPRVVLAGLPNAGKSTLFNALAGQDSALVSEVAGTTRDYLSAAVLMGNTSVELIDTAGMESANEGVDSVAQSLGRGQHEHADLLIWCTAANLNGQQTAVDSQSRAELEVPIDRIVFVTTKGDLAEENGKDCHCMVSATTADGLDQLRSVIVSRLSNPVASQRQMLGSTSARCHESLNNGLESLQSARETTVRQAGDELIAVELRIALDAIGRILGVVYTDDILDHIFSNFCIGK
jgi:tRNA modification GTPase